MALLLNIDTATEHAGICLSNDETVLGLIESPEQKNHAVFLQPAIGRLMAETGYSLQNLDGVAVTAGPGSYTGLRVGLASAKGICFALGKPLILVNTLEVMAEAIISSLPDSADRSVLICPMIDARRMEVFTALYDTALTEIEAPQALIMDLEGLPPAFQKPTLFGGSGAEKLKKISKNPHAAFSEVQHSAAHLAKRALLAFRAGHFADLAYAEPIYVKAFHDTAKKV